MYTKNCMLFVSAAVLLFFQVHALMPLGKSGVRPDLLLCFVMYIGVTFSPCRGGIICFLTGYSLELFSGANSGLYIVLYLTVYLSIKALKKVFNFDTIPEQFLLLIGCSALKVLVLFFASVFIYEYSSALDTRTIIGEALYTAVLFPVVFPLLCSIYKDPRTIQESYTTLSNVRRVQ